MVLLRRFWFDSPSAEVSSPRKLPAMPSRVVLRLQTERRRSYHRHSGQSSVLVSPTPGPVRPATGSKVEATAVHLTLRRSFLPRRLGVPVIKVSRGLSPPSHFPIRFRSSVIPRQSLALRAMPGAPNEKSPWCFVHRRAFFPSLLHRRVKV